MCGFRRLTYFWMRQDQYFPAQQTLQGATGTSLCRILYRDTAVPNKFQKLRFFFENIFKLQIEPQGAKSVQFSSYSGFFFSSPPPYDFLVCPFGFTTTFWGKSFGTGDLAKFRDLKLKSRPGGLWQILRFEITFPQKVVVNRKGAHFGPFLHF